MDLEFPHSSATEVVLDSFHDVSIDNASALVRANFWKMRGGLGQEKSSSLETNTAIHDVRCMSCGFVFEMGDI